MPKFKNSNAIFWVIFKQCDTDDIVTAMLISGHNSYVYRSWTQLAVWHRSPDTLSVALNGQEKLPEWNSSLSQLVPCLQCSPNDVFHVTRNPMAQNIFNGRSSSVSQIESTVKASMLDLKNSFALPNFEIASAIGQRIGVRYSKREHK